MYTHASTHKMREEHTGISHYRAWYISSGRLPNPSCSNGVGSIRLQYRTLCMDGTLILHLFSFEHVEQFVNFHAGHARDVLLGHDQITRCRRVRNGKICVHKRNHRIRTLSRNGGRLRTGLDVIPYVSHCVARVSCAIRDTQFTQQRQCGRSCKNCKCDLCGRTRTLGHICMSRYAACEWLLCLYVYWPLLCFDGQMKHVFLLGGLNA